MWKLWVLVVLLAVAVTLWLELGCFSACDGSYELAVRVKSTAPEPIETVRCEVIPGVASLGVEPAEAERLFKQGAFKDVAPSGRAWRITLHPSAEDQPFSIDVRNNCHLSMLRNRELSFAQERGLVVAVQYRGGKQAGKIVELPDGRVSRAVAVTFH